MSKGKFSLGLAPLKIPSKAETRALKEALAAHNLSVDSFSPPASPFIDRGPPLDAFVESQLRTACAALAAGSIIPQDDTDDVLLNAIRFANGHMSQDTQKDPLVEDMSLDFVETHPTKYAYKPNKTLNEIIDARSLPEQQKRMQALLAKKNQEIQEKLDAVGQRVNIGATAVAAPLNNPTETSTDSAGQPVRPKTAPAADSSDVSYSSPMSASTARFGNYTSTAMTSIATTPFRPSKRGSAQFSSEQQDMPPAAIQEVNVKAQDWMRQEFERRQRQHDQQQKPPQQPLTKESRDGKASKPQSETRGSSRTRRWGAELKDDIKEYIRPRRSQSSTRPDSQDGRSSCGSERPPSPGGWRSWRRASPHRPNDPIHASTNQESKDIRKAHVNLNRDLPPLPSIDLWKPAEKGNHHIASMLKSKSIGQIRAELVNATRFDADGLPCLMFDGESGEKTMASDIELAVARPSPKLLHSVSSSQDSGFSPTSGMLSKPMSISDAHRVDSVVTDDGLPPPIIAKRKDSLPDARMLRNTSRSTSTLNTVSTANSEVQQRPLAAAPTLSVFPTSRPPTRGGMKTPGRPAAAAEPSPPPNFSVPSARERSRTVTFQVDPSHAENAGGRKGSYVEVTALPPLPSKNKGKLRLATGLKKVLGGKITAQPPRRDLTEGARPRTAPSTGESHATDANWMHQIEAAGVKRGVLAEQNGYRAFHKRG